MAAYIIAQINVTDPETFERYRDKVPAIIERHGGRYLIRGGATLDLEGTLPRPRVVVIEFADKAAAERFYHSPDYQEIVPLRTSAAEGSVTLVEGVPPA